jgi:hypothetical protein
MPRKPPLLSAVRQRPQLVNRSSPTLRDALQAQYGPVLRAILEKQSALH